MRTSPTSCRQGRAPSNSSSATHYPRWRHLRPQAARHGVHRSTGFGEERPLLEARPPVETTQPEGDESRYHRKHPGCPAGPVPSGYEVHSAPDIALRAEDVRDSGGDFDTSMTPFEAGLGKFIDLEKKGFVGREALLVAKRSKRLYGLLCRDLTPRSGSGIFDGDDQVGFVTTGAQSPYLDTGIGYVRFDHGGNWSGKSLSMRSGTYGNASCEIVDLPFYDREKVIPRGRNFGS